MREGTLRTLNAFAKELGSEPVLVRAGNETIAELFKTLSQKITAEKLERLEELCDEWEHHGDDHGSIQRTKGAFAHSALGVLGIFSHLSKKLFLEPAIGNSL